MEAERVGSYGAYPPSKPPLGRIRTDDGSLDLATPEFAERPVAFAEALQAQPNGNESGCLEIRLVDGV